MDAGIHPALGEIQHLRDSAWEAISTATVDGADRNRYWKAWTAHCALYNPQLAPGAAHLDTNRLLTFAVAVQEGQYGN
jgi:hypothetical protein